jgi:hypothetical protein
MTDDKPPGSQLEHWIKRHRGRQRRENGQPAERCHADIFGVHHGHGVHSRRTLDKGTAFCIIETNGQMAGVVISGLDSSPATASFKVTVWKYAP